MRYENNGFSKWFEVTAKSEKISYGKIAEKIGKSERTVFRYAKGECNVTEEIREKILKAIIEIKGCEVADYKSSSMILREQVNKEKKFPKMKILARGLKEIEKILEQHPEIRMSDDEEIERKERDAEHDRICFAFSVLSDKMQKILLEELKAFHSLKEDAFNLVINFNCLTNEQQKIVIELLDIQVSTFKLYEYPEIAEEYSYYLHMMKRTKEERLLDSNIKEKSEIEELMDKQMEIQNYDENEITMEYCEALNKLGGDTTKVMDDYLVYIFDFESIDWLLIANYTLLGIEVDAFSGIKEVKAINTLFGRSVTAKQLAIYKYVDDLVPRDEEKDR